MNEKRPTVSIVIPTLNSGRTIRKCLDSIIGLDCPKDKLEIIIVDGGSVDDTLEIAKKYQVKVISIKKRGRGLAYNVGFKFAKGEYVAYLDSDAYASSNWINASLKGFEEDEKLGVVYNKNLAPEDSPFFQRCIDVLHSRGRGQANGAIYRKKALEDIGGFNQDVVYLQETELKNRLRVVGYRERFLDDGIIYHYPRSSIATYAQQCLESGIGVFQLLNQTGGWERMANLFLTALTPFVLILIAIFSLANEENFTFLFSIITLFVVSVFYGLIVYRTTEQRYRRWHYIILAVPLSYSARVTGFLGFIYGLMMHKAGDANEKKFIQ